MLLLAGSFTWSGSSFTVGLSAFMLSLLLALGLWSCPRLWREDGSMDTSSLPPSHKTMNPEGVAGRREEEDSMVTSWKLVNCQKISFNWQ